MRQPSAASVRWTMVRAKGDRWMIFRGKILKGTIEWKAYSPFRIGIPMRW